MLPVMSERKKRVRDESEVREYWQAISEDAAVRWRQETFPSGGVETYGPIALVVYGEVSWRRLQEVELSKLTTMRPGFPEFDTESPPNETELARLWNSAANTRKRADIQRMIEDPDYRKDYRATFEPRQPDEPIGDFYARVAEYYRMRTILTGRPTSDLATAADVPKSTASRWVREARIRGFLPQTSKGRSAS
jgi:hypothetical protein